MAQESYPGKLERSAGQSASLVCMGLDPKPAAYPYEDLEPAERVRKVFEELFEDMLRRSVVPAAFKPNIGYYHRLDRPLEGDFSGSLALASLLSSLRDAFPALPVILDAKRGDIATSSANYADEAFRSWKADAVTVAPYMGSDSVSPFTSWSSEGKGVYILNRTSNPGGADFQNLLLYRDAGSSGVETGKGLHGGDRPLYLHVAESIARRAGAAPGTGAVVGATNPRELEELASFYAESGVPLLIPGVGGQGGSASVTMEVLRRSGYPLSLARINSSSGLTHPWAKRGETAPANWKDICLDALEELNGEIAYEA